MIVVLGSINADVVLVTDRLPAVGETIRASGIATYPGGKGANQAVAAARMGAAVQLIGRVGDDDAGRDVVRRLTDAGVDTDRVAHDADHATGRAFITVAASGENTIVTAGGANHAVGDVELAALERSLEVASMLVIQLEIPMHVVADAVRAAALREVPVLLDPAPVAPIPSDVYRHITWLTPNEHEAAELTGTRHEQRAAQILSERGVAHAVVTLGERGCFYAGRRVAAPRVDAVDTVACGDAFNGALAAQLAAGSQPDDALRVACAAGAAAATVPGAFDSMPTRERVEALLEPIL